MYDTETALVVVDMQNDFADPEGSLFVGGGDAVVGTVNREIVAAIASGAFVVYTQDWHPESTPHFEKDGGVWPVHCVAGSWGAEFHPRLLLAGPVVRKGSNGEDGYSGFTMRDPVSGATIPTELEAMLEERGVRRVVVAGLALDYCVKATALDANRLGHPASVLRDATAAVNLQVGDDARTVDELEGAGVTLR